MSRTPETLVFAPRNLSALVRALPTFQVLAGDRSLAVLSPAEFHPLLKLFPGVESILPWRDSEDATVSVIRRSDSRYGVLLDGSLDAAWLAFSGALEERWGYSGGLRTFFVKPRVERSKGVSEADPRWFGALLRGMGLPLPQSEAGWVPTLQVTDEVREMGQHFVERARVPQTEGPLVGLAAVSDLPLAALWPWQRYAELARTLRRQNPRVRQILLARGERLWPVVRIHEETASFYPVLGPDLDLAALTGVLSQLDLLISSEGGLLHLAAALGVPCLGLFGRRDPEVYAPAGDQHRMFRRPPSPFASLFGSGRFLQNLEVEEVVEAAERMLFGGDS